MKTSVWSVILFVWYCLSVTAAATASRQVDASSTPLLERFLASEEPALRTYRARRVLRATNPRFHAQGTLEAITELAADGSFRYQIVREEGSQYVRSRDDDVGGTRQDRRPIGVRDDVPI